METGKNPVHLCTQVNGTEEESCSVGTEAGGGTEVQETGRTEELIVLLFAPLAEYMHRSARDGKN
ncbi:hypothetical protein [Oryza sativa Japonica Group]|uniref:Uncharacterized protein n=1 Tax=Oryza sativa subsp. japonica TaxID=39947 RepID=Q5QMV7_ORYSJ|nr:hypothetical protein [Oryza sativa Japonica Group]BAD73255.1 hypothetical protein [Oryza sativa Japonica Group]